LREECQKRDWLSLENLNSNLEKTTYMLMDLEKSKIASVLKGMSIFCGILIIPFPVGVYYITRVVVCVGAIYAAIKIKKHFPEEFNRVVFLWFLAFLFNPLLPLYFQARPIWIILDIVALIAFYSSAQLFKNSRPLSESEDRETVQETREIGKTYWVVEERNETPFIPKGTMQKDSKGMLGKEVIPELTDPDEPPFTSEESLKPDSEDMMRNEVISELTDTANLDSEKKRGSRKEFKSVLDVAVQYFFEVVKEIYEGNFNVREANLFRGRFQTENNFKLGLWKITRIESEAISFASHHNEIIISQVFTRGKLKRDHPKVVEVSNYLNSII